MRTQGKTFANIVKNKSFPQTYFSKYFFKFSLRFLEWKHGNEMLVNFTPYLRFSVSYAPGSGPIGSPIRKVDPHIFASPPPARSRLPIFFSDLSFPQKERKKRNLLGLQGNVIFGSCREEKTLFFSGRGFKSGLKS